MMLYYSDGELVEEFDHIEATLDKIGPAMVESIHPRSGTITVKYEDWMDCRKKDARPKIKKIKLAVDRINFIRRDG